MGCSDCKTTVPVSRWLVFLGEVLLNHKSTDHDGKKKIVHLPRCGGLNRAPSCKILRFKQQTKAAVSNHFGFLARASAMGTRVAEFYRGCQFR